MPSRSALAAAFALLLAACAAPAPRPTVPLTELASADPGARQRVAEALAEADGPPPEAIVPLYHALRREPNPQVYGALLVALGASGIAEVRPLIDARVNDPDGDTQRWARRALQKWLVRNLLLSEGEALPPPPHRLYARPEVLPPGAPGATPTPGLAQGGAD